MKNTTGSKKRFKRPLVIIAATLAVGLIIAGVTVLSALPDFTFACEDMTFEYDNKILTGRLALPSNAEGPFPAALFIHGDGPENRTGSDYYLYLWQKLTDAGIACFSWDKQGIGESEGNWEHQSMEDRAKETLAAAAFLKQDARLQKDQIGLIGFSQGGWVMPYAAALSENTEFPAFIISVSGAVNVFSQGEFYNRNRLRTRGLPASDIEQYILANRELYRLIDAGLDYTGYVEYWKTHLAAFEGPGAEPDTRGRFIFSSLPWPDVRTHLKSVTCPVLAIFGSEDRNVDIHESIQVYEQEFLAMNHQNFTIRVFDNGTHALTRADLFQHKSIGVTDILIYGEEIFARDYLESIQVWLAARTRLDWQEL